MNVCALSLCSGCEVPVSPVPVIFFLLESIQAHPCVHEPWGLCQVEFAPGLDCTPRIRLHSSGSLFFVGEGCFLEVGGGRLSLPPAGRGDGTRESVRSGLLRTQLCGEGDFF